MATLYSDDHNSNRVQPGISRSRAGGTSPGRTGYSGNRRPASSRSSSAGRRASGRSANYRTGTPSGRGPAPGNRRPNRRRRSPMPTIVAVAAILILVLVLVVLKPFGGRGGDPVIQNTAAPVSNSATQTQSQVESTVEIQSSNLQDALADMENSAGSLSADQMATISDLHINTGLPSEWMNVLLLGTDERTLSDSARTDAMLICSINRNTGEVKLTSIMRDLAIEFNDIGQWNGTWRINAANFFGGPNLAMRTINEKFGMNIQYYVMVNFFGFQKIAQRLGGVELDITKEEMDKINILIVQQAKVAYAAGIDESDQENVYLETYGENTHLNGRQALAYARIRKLTGGDAMRTERQRKVLQKLMEKAKQLDAISLASLAMEMKDQIKTNLPIDDIVNIGLQVTANGLTNIKSMYLPVSGSYKLETRNNQSMLYDCDFTANATQLYNFIYEQ